MLEIPKRKTSYGKLLLPAGIVIATVAVFYMFNHAAALFTQTDSKKVLIVEAMAGDVIAKVRGFGRLDTRGASTQIARVKGTIAQIHAYPGESLRKGDPIITLVNPDLERAFEQAQMQVLEAKANGEGVKATLLREEMALSSKIELSTNDIKFATKEYETMGTLIKERIVSRLDYLKAETNLERAQHEAKLATRQLQTYQVYKASQLKAVDYKIRAAERNLALAKRDLDYLIVRAESDGLLNEFSQNYQKGSPIAQGSALVEISDPSRIYATLSVTASEAEFVAPGQEVNVTIRQLGYSGKVTRIFPKVENNQVTLEVDLLDHISAGNIDNIEVTGSITVATVNDTLKLPTPTSISKRAKEMTLYVKEGDAFYRRSLKLGIVSATEVQVLEGLTVGQQVAFNVPSPLDKKAKIMSKELIDG